jgi:regulator of replication initiation timing
MPSKELAAKLKKSDADVQAYVRELDRQNAKLVTRNAQLEAENTTLENRIAALKKGKEDPQDEMTPQRVQELHENLIQAVREMGHTVILKNAS